MEQNEDRGGEERKRERERERQRKRLGYSLASRRSSGYKQSRAHYFVRFHPLLTIFIFPPARFFFLLLFWPSLPRFCRFFSTAIVAALDPRRFICIRALADVGAAFSFSAPRPHAVKFTGVICIGLHFVSIVMFACRRAPIRVLRIYTYENAIHVYAIFLLWRYVQYICAIARSNRFLYFSIFFIAF